MSARALARAFTPPPTKVLWQWADETVMLQNEDAAEPGSYRSAKTPWTRRIQELMHHPFMHVWSFEQQKWVQVKVTEINVQKSSQSGFSEAVLNRIRWLTVFRPCNIIYAIDSAEEATKIARRLLRSFKFLDKSIFTGNPNDITKLEFKLRGMELLFYGSFSSGKFANKQAPFCVSDEVEEHGLTTSVDDLASRKKTSKGGLQVNLSKPKLSGGPINKAFLRGNQEEFFVPCPHPECGAMQYLTFFSEERDVPFSDEMMEIQDEQTGEVVARLPRPLPLGEKRKMRTGRFVFEHCKNLLGAWDKLRILTESYYECACCQRPIYESSKRWMINRGEWRPMEVSFTPGIVSQHHSDLYSEDELSSWGQIILEYLDAKDAKSGSHEKLMGFYNHRLGKEWSNEINKPSDADILSNIAGRSLWFVDAPNSHGQLVRNIFTDQASADRLSESNRQRGVDAPVIHSVCPAYVRGTIPFPPFRANERQSGNLLLGSDVGGSYARWVVIAVHQNLEDVAVVDWGEELDPDSIRLITENELWTVSGTGEQCRIGKGWIDARHRPRDVYQACLASQGRLIPCQGIGGMAARGVKLWSFVHVPTYHPKFKKLDINDQRAKDALYIDRIKKKRKRLWLPTDVERDRQFIDELCGEEQVMGRYGLVWDDENPSPNHYGDALKYAIAGLDFITRSLRTGVAE